MNVIYMEGDEPGNFIRAEEVETEIEKLKGWVNNSNEIAARLYDENQSLKQKIKDLEADRNGWKQRALELYY